MKQTTNDFEFSDEAEGIEIQLEKKEQGAIE